MNGCLDLLAFAGVMALGQFSPGPDMILITRTALRDGVRAGVEMGLGIACGLTVQATLAVAGWALAFDRLPRLREYLGWAAAVYLVWLAGSIFRELFNACPAGGEVDPEQSTTRRRPFLRGLFCNLLNPKAAFFLTAVSTPFLRGDRPEWWPLAMVGIVVVQGGVLWALWAWLLQWNPLRRSYGRASRWIDAVFGFALLLLAMSLFMG